LQVGKYAEYFVKMEFTLYGFEVYTAEVDDRCIDFVARRDGSAFYEVQVKSVRGYNYVFVPKSTFALVSSRLLVLVLFHQEREPALYLIPATAWLSPDALLVGRDYGREGQTSQPEWGLNLSAKNQHLLDRFRFADRVASL